MPPITWTFRHTPTGLILEGSLQDDFTGEVYESSVPIELCPELFPAAMDAVYQAIGEKYHGRSSED